MDRHEAITNIADDIIERRLSDIESEFGEPWTHEFGFDPAYFSLGIRKLTAVAETHPDVTWKQILSADFYLAVGETEHRAARKALVNLAATVVAVIEDLDNRAGQFAEVRSLDEVRAARAPFGFPYAPGVVSPAFDFRMVAA